MKDVRLSILTVEAVDVIVGAPLESRRGRLAAARLQLRAGHHTLVHEAAVCPTRHVINIVRKH